jgi:hypothetical protein
MRLKAILIFTLGLIAASPGRAQNPPRPVAELTLNCRAIPGGVATIAVTGNVDLAAIRKRGKPDVVLQARDILYLPENSTAKNVDTAIQAMAGACLPADRNDSKFEAPDPR